MLCGWKIRDVQLRILLIGNYLPDAQESMQRFADLMRSGLSEAGHEVTLAVPLMVLNVSGHAARGVWKWIGYLDKYVLSAPQLRRAAQQADIVHVCDHSNSLYVPSQAKVPYVVTCHDLLAVRGAIGEDTDCPAGFMGRRLQRAILRGLRRAQAMACDSEATLRDAKRLLSGYPGRLVAAPIALNYPYRVLEPRVVQDRLTAVKELSGLGSYVLHVGSNLRRKNREGVLHAVAAVASQWNGKLVFAGQPLTAELISLAEELKIADRIVEVPKPSNEALEALYNGALALMFPSRFEGFGWPIIEAQACGCPVICSDREPCPEVAGDGAVVFDPEDYIGFGTAVVRLSADAEARESLRRRGLENVRRYAKAKMIAHYVSLYEELGIAA
jgi:glycosyltransferase involved in cell wall biosynthesis